MISVPDERGDLPLDGRRIVPVGRLAALDREAFGRLVTSLGGTVAQTVTSNVTTVVVGGAGWPVRKDGRISFKLERVRQLARRGVEIEVVREVDWLEGLGLFEETESIRRRYSLGEIESLTGVSPRRVRDWVRSGALSPAESSGGVDPLRLRASDDDSAA